MDYRRSTHHVYLNNYHLVWCPKRRKPVLIGPVRERFIEISREVAADNSWDILELAVQPDHVHLFVSVPPTIPPNKIVAAIKGRTSSMLRKEFPELLKLPSLWTHSYFSSTAGNISAETIKKYMKEQSRL
jgi:putative transposase